MKNNPQIGLPINRLEGELKVTGSAKYAGEYQVEDLLQGYIVNSTITKGKILDIDESLAKAVPGVLHILSHKNRPKLAWFDFMYTDMDAPPGVPFKPLYNDEIVYNRQPIALVIAETFEAARYAASLLKVSYKEEGFKTDLAANLSEARNPKKGMATFLKPLPPKPTGDFDKAYKQAAAKYEGEYLHGTEHHNPIELFATTSVYEGDGKITVYDKTQGTNNCQIYIANVFGLHYKDVRVISPFVGGAFGSGLRPQYQLFLCVMATLELKKNIRVTMDRTQMFTFGHRPQTLQKTKFGADAAGKLTALNHTAIAETSQFEDYTEVVVNQGPIIYPVKNTMQEYQLVELDVFTPIDMRAPGGSTGMHAIEATMDELSYQLKIDPLEFRLINYGYRDESSDKPFSSKELEQCYLQGAEKFKWSERNPEPGVTRRGNRLVGTGMSTGVWEVMALPAKAKASIDAAGKLTLTSAVTDIGTGTKTVMTQIAADQFGLEIEQVLFDHGDSKMPMSPIQGGSYTTGVVGSAVKQACTALKEKLFKLAKKADDSPFKSHQLEEVTFDNGNLFLTGEPSQEISLKQIIEDNGGEPIEASKTDIPNFIKLGKYTRMAHSAAFVEVEVDEELGVVNVTRAVTAVAAGKIINPKTARSQILGGMVWGISKALREQTLMDHDLGKYMNTNLGEYHIPVHADIHELDVIFVEEKDDIINELGVKGVGEIGLTAMSPAIANAIFHATGKRINNFPIHFNELMK